MVPYDANQTLGVSKDCIHCPSMNTMENSQSKPAELEYSWIPDPIYVAEGHDQ